MSPTENIPRTPEAGDGLGRCAPEWAFDGEASTMLKRTKHFFRYRHRRWIASISLLLAMVGASGASVKLTSKASFCKSCHLMESYHASWTTDAHNHIECVKCHIAPGFEHMIHAKLDGLAQMVNNSLGRAATRPSAHVSDDSCLRSGCHVTSALGRSEGEERGYIFDHQAHFGLDYMGFAIHCTTCHSYVRGDVHFEVNTNACLTCHLVETPGARKLQVASDLSEHRAASTPVLGANGRKASVTHASGERHASAECQTCHNAPSEPINYGGLIVNHSEYLDYGASCTSCHQGVTAAPQPVEDSRCLSCHGFGMERKLETSELHRVHAEARHKVQCFNCHGLIQHGPQVQAAMSKDLECKACHDNSHSLQRAAYMNEAPPHAAHVPTLSREGMPENLPVSPMFMAHVSCTGCHVETDASRAAHGNGTTVARASAAACDTCHRPGLGERTIPLWQRTTRDLYKEVQDLFPSAERRATANAEAAALLVEAEQFLELVRLDGSWGVHNPRYTQRLLEDARSKVLEARALMSGASQAGGNRR
jgi:nitrate/TMAO reductase-like tetraheme cytochrome c subunit